MRPQILVTGATGTVGALVAQGLCDRGARVVALVHTPDKVDTVVAGCAEVRVADLRDDRQARAALQGVHKVFMVTPVTPDQVEIGDEIAAAAADAGVDHIVKLSIFGAEARHASLLARWDRHVEKSIESVGLRWTFLRPNSLMQGFINLWGRTIPAQGRFHLPLGDAAVSYVDARDVAAVGVETLLGDGHDGTAYTLTGPVAHTHAEIAKAIAHASGRPVEYASVSEDAAREGLELQGVPEPLITGFLEYWALQRHGGGAVVTGDIEEVTGRAPIGLEQFARDHAAAWKAP